MIRFEIEKKYLSVVCSVCFGGGGIISVCATVLLSTSPVFHLQTEGGGFFKYSRFQ